LHLTLWDDTIYTATNVEFFNRNLSIVYSGGSGAASASGGNSSRVFAKKPD
jgi:hypothetical protein